MKVFLQSLGCSKNQVDSEMLLGVCKNLGFKISPTPENCDLLIVNTCAFIETAREEAISQILEIADYKTEKTKFIVAGCLSQRYKDELVVELPEVDYFLRIVEYFKAAEIISNVCNLKMNNNPQMDYLDRVYTSDTSYMRYVRISDGCLNRCAFCAIPLIRGKLKSRAISDIVAEVNLHVKNGAKEINIISQDTTNYGFDLEHRLMLVDLLKELVLIPGDFRIRLFYLYPEIVTDELISFIKNNPKIMPYFDIPIQHSEDKILKKMLRRSTRDEMVTLFKKIRKEIPGAILRTTVMVGFPYEEEEDVHNLCEFIKEIKFDRLGCFTFSLEENTPATRYPQVISEEEKMKRYNMVMDIQYQVSLDLNTSHIGEICDVIVEGYNEENMMYVGRSYAFAPDDIDGCVYIAAHSEKKIGDTVRVKIMDADAYSLTAEEYEED